MQRVVALRIVLLFAVAMSVAVPAWSSTGTATLTAGSLELTTPASISFSATLTGLDQTADATQAIDVSDATGSGAGWDLQATSTAFCTAGDAHCLADTATTIAAPGPTVACAAGATCTVASNTASYPYALPAAATAPTATTFFAADASSGMGAQVVTATFTVAIPANTYAGVYDSTWTYSLVSAP
jgi:hypothetical protein